MTERTALTALLAAEHATVYAYGVLGARLTTAVRVQALAAFDSHRAARDALVVQLRGHDVPAPAPAAAYDVTVASELDAMRLATRVESELAVLWRDLVAATDDAALRRLAVAQLQGCAVRATTWRKTARIAPLTVALPGEA